MVASIEENTSNQTEEIGQLTESKNNNLKEEAKTTNKKASVYVYPINRDVKETDDFLLIKSIEYRSPGEGEGVGIEWDPTQSAEWLDSFESGTSNNSQTKKPLKPLIENSQTKDGKGGFSIRNEDMTDRITKPGAKNKINYYIELPIPQQVNDSNACIWGDDTMNVFELAGLAVGKTLIKQGLDIGTALKKANAISQNMNNLISLPISGEAKDALQAAFAGAAINQLGSNVSFRSVLSRSTGQVLNSNLELLFQGAALRSFPFDITFSPRSRKEGEVVKNIIRALKKSMAPKKGGGADTLDKKGKFFLQAPDLFLLRYMRRGEDHPFLNAFKPCALSQLNVNYTGAGTYSTYGDSTPTNIQMRMVFKEINPIYSEDYDDDTNSGPGVGY